MITTVPEVSDVGLRRPADEEARARYAAYRVRQARGLVRMLPREAVRPLYRRALMGPGEVGLQADPLAVLLEYCERLLPLPPFEVWLEDRMRDPVAYLHDLDDSADTPTAAAPATIAACELEHLGKPWIAHLRCFLEGGAWRGYIAFEGVPSGQVYRTALVFRESTSVDLRERFLSFESSTLEAFLRSALP